MASYTYTLEGRKFTASQPLTDSQLEELAASLKQETAPAAPPVTTYEAIGSQGQPIMGISTETVPVTDSNIPPQPSAVTSSGFLMGLKDPISAGAQMLPRVLSGVTSLGGIVPNLFSDWLSSEAQRVDAMVKAEEAQYQARRQQEGEQGIDWARVAGNVFNPATLGIAGATARALPAATGAIGTGAVTGLTTGVFQPVTEGGFAEQKAKQALAGTLGGGAGAAVMTGAGRVVSPLVSKAEQTMRDLGVQLTPGQMMGGQAKAFEEFAQNLPLVGRFISDARQRALFSFNKGVINKALGKVGENLPEDVIGRDAVQYANDVISQKYDDVLSNVKFSLDTNTYNKLVQALKQSTLPSQQQNEAVKSILDDVLYSKIPQGTSIPGEAFKKIESDLGKTASRYANSAMAAERDIGDALNNVSKALKAALAEQNPTQSSILRRINNAYGDIVVMRTAAANSGATNGVFTPSQYRSAVRQRDVTRGKTAFAAGKARGQDVADAASQILERDTASTLEGRLATQVGGGLAALSAPSISVPVAIAAPILYSESGIKVMNVLMRSRPEIAKKIGETLTARATKEGSITGQQVMREYNRITKTEQ